MDEERPAFEETLLHYGLEKGDLNIKCPDEVRNKIAQELEDWNICQTLAREGFRFPESRIAAIARCTVDENKRKIDLLHACMRHGKTSSTYLSLAEALYLTTLDGLLGKLCEARESCSDAPQSQRSDEGRGGMYKKCYCCHTAKSELYTSSSLPRLQTCFRTIHHSLCGPSKAIANCSSMIAQCPIKAVIHYYIHPTFVLGIHIQLAPSLHK